jgi:hypothetical protein
MRVDPRRQWRLLRSESLLPAVSTAADVCAAYPTMTIFARLEMLTAERP